MQSWLVVSRARLFSPITNVIGLVDVVRSVFKLEGMSYGIIS